MPLLKNKPQLTLLSILEEEDDNKEEEVELTNEGKAAVKVATKDNFSFLDMKLLWDKEGNLEFKVYQKKGQALKYVDK
eukprot:9932786-Ditylum_brightwellii.AAC.1